MSYFTRVISLCEKQYESDYGLFDVPLNLTGYCSCGNKLKEALIYAECSDNLVKVKVCRKCHSILPASMNK